MATLYIVIGILTAICTAAWLCSLVRDRKWHSALIVCGCIVAAICGVLWLPLALFTIAFFAKELHQSSK